MKRQALGKGLSSLIPDPPPKKEAGILMLDVDRIRPNHYQPRSDFSGLEGLADSIKESGIIQPIVVRQEPDGFSLVAGERRWRAAQLAGLHRIPAVVRKLPDNRLLEVALVENIQRKELNPIEEAHAYEVLLDQMKLTQAEVARRVGRERSSISNSLRLLKLPSPVQDLIREGTVTVGHAKAIMALSDPVTQIRLANEVASALLSVRETEAMVARQQKNAGSRREEGSKAAEAIDPNVQSAEERLCRALATRVRIIKRGDRGRVEIEFYSDEELDRLFNALMTAERGH
jgi:ParB family chromosome partitioning protein